MMASLAPLSALKGAGRTSTTQAFADLLGDLQVEHSKPVASRQQQALRERLGSRIELTASYLTGSYRRNTQIPPLNDIDVLLVLDWDTYVSFLEDPESGTVDALDLVQEALRASYPYSEMERHECCIRIQFAGTGIGFDVIPAFQNGANVFLIPDENRGKWVPTNPKEHQRLVSEANQHRCGGMLIPLVKLMKATNEAMGKPLTGFHVEMLVYYALGHTPISYAAGMAYLLSQLASTVWSAVPDPWPLGQPVDHYLTSEKRVIAAAELRSAADLALEAIAADERGDLDAAHRCWRRIFGEDRYPVRGGSAKSTRMSPSAAASAVAASARISATSAGLVRPGGALYGARTPTSHGGASPHRAQKWSGSSPDVEWHERQILRVLRQFNLLKRISPEEAAADPRIPEVGEEDLDSLYAVLIGDQFTNLGVRHRLLILIPKDAPGVEPAIYDLRPFQPARITGNGWKPRRMLLHRWGGGVLCTHAARDAWDGQLVTLVVWAVDWLFRQDYYQRHGRWLGPQIDRRGRLMINGAVVTNDRLLQRGTSQGRRVPL